jgi:hypothetical protein
VLVLNLNCFSYFNALTFLVDLTFAIMLYLTVRQLFLYLLHTNLEDICSQKIRKRLRTFFRIQEASFGIQILLSTFSGDATFGEDTGNFIVSFVVCTHLRPFCWRKVPLKFSEDVFSS